MPVRNVPPSESCTEWSAHVPTTFAFPTTPGEDQFLEAGDHACTGTSKIGAKAVMLLCQKTDLILGRPDSGRYAPELAGRKSTPPISSGGQSASGVTT